MNAWLRLNFSKHCSEHMVLFFSLKSINDTATLNHIKTFYYNEILKNVSQFILYTLWAAVGIPMFRKLDFQGYTLLIHILLKVAWAYGKNMDFGIRYLNQILVQSFFSFWLWSKHFFFSIVFLFLKWERYTLADMY